MSSENRNVALRHLQTLLSAGMLGSLPDRVLLERFLAGRGNADSSSAFAALVERHGPMVLGVCRDVLRNVHDAEDAAQATFLILARNGASIRRVDSLASWLFGVALRVAARSKVEAARRRAIECRGGEMKARSGGNGPAAFLPELHEELNRLPERFRAPVVLCHLEGLSNEQAAAQLRVPVRTIQRRLAQGRERLRGRLVRRGIDPLVGLLGPGFTTHASSEAWLDATVRAASGLAAGQEIAVVASTTVTVLTQGVLTMMFIGRLKIAAGGLVAAAAVAVTFIGAGSAIAARRQSAQAPAKIGAGQSVAKTDVGKAANAPSVRIGPWIKGVVVADTSGKPVGGAQVTSLWTSQPGFVSTKTDGTFAVPNEETRVSNLSFLATAGGGAYQGIFRFDDQTTGLKDARTLVRIVLKPARTVTVSVVDGNGAPVEGAAVSVLDLIFPVAVGRTDSRGVVTLRAPVDAMTQWIVGYKSGVGLDYFENYRALPPLWSTPPERARLVLAGARTVRVRAKDSADKSVPGVDIVPWLVKKRGKLSSVNLCGFSGRVRSDEQGVATFDWFPSDVEAGASFVLATASYFLPKWPILEAGKMDAELTARVFRFTPISGKVTRPDGSPAAGILVAAEGVGDAYPAGSSRARSAADGSFKMELPPNQSYTVYVNDDEWAAKSRTGVVIREGQPHPDVSIRLQPGALIHGRVTAGPEAQPAPGVTVMLYEQGPAVPERTLVNQPSSLHDGAMRVADTDSDGRYAFRVGPGDYQLTRPRQAGDDGETPSEQLKVRDGQEIGRDFQLARQVRPLRYVRGVVRAQKPDGPPIAGAIVAAEPIGARIPPAHGFADENGRFQLYRPFGKGLVYARDPIGNLAGFTIVDADADADLAVVTQPAATARGRVVDAAGKPCKGISVAYAVELPIDEADNEPARRRRRRAASGMMGGMIGSAPGPRRPAARDRVAKPAGGANMDNPETAVAGQSATTDENGRFTAPGLVVGTRCRLFANHPDGGQSPEQSFMVEDTTPIDLGDIVLRPR
jgi:RNA polymerase sigma factor (sigma-70 family)